MQENVYEPPWVPAGKSAEAPYVSILWKIFAYLSAVVLLLGYLMLAVVFGESNDDLHVDPTATGAVAFLFIGIAYAASIVIAFFKRSSKAFILRSILMPYLMINLIALFNIIFNIIARNLFPLSAVRVVSIGLPCTFTLIYGLTSFLIYREFGVGGLSRAREGSSMPLLNEGEQQRQNFARLLESRNGSAPSPELIQNTYRLDLPNLERVQTDHSRQFGAHTA